MKNKTLKLNNMKKYFIFLFISLFLINCYPKESLHITVTEYIKVDTDYQYSSFLFYENNKYKPILKSIYINDSIKSFSLFKSEGEIYYDKTDLKTDKLLSKTFNIVEVRRIKRLNSAIIDNDNSYNIFEQKNDSVYCIVGQKLIVYIIH